jgi:hypothetical protein
MAKSQGSADLVREVAREGFDHAKEILQAIEVMQRYQTLVRIKFSLMEARAHNAGAAVLNGLIARIYLLVAGSYSRTRDGDKHLRVAFEILQSDYNIRKQIVGNGTDAELKEAEALWHRLLSDPRLVAFKHFRDKFTAHFATPDPQRDIPSHNDFYGFATETTGLMEKLARATGVTKQSLEELKDAFADSAQQFWNPWDPSRRS